ncbi:hypothetical protein L6452_15681 [Arctium lappa]|uniref:Uncharacterized protein n=1 Tax=Arctium lappa TaxID=4217 RepID=A0ACB9CPC6_ARCLA|nr:hypothetical protein L6452_15681 [Arctium lappa]
MISPTSTTTKHGILSKDPTSTNPTVEEKLIATVELFDSEAVLEMGKKDNELKASESVDYGSLVSCEGKESESESVGSNSRDLKLESVNHSKAKESESVNDQFILEASLIDPNSMKTQENEGVNVGKSATHDPQEMINPFTSILKDVNMFPEGVLEDPSKEPPTILKPVDYELNSGKQIDTVPVKDDSGFELVKNEKEADAIGVLSHDVCGGSQPTNVEMKRLAKTRPKRLSKRPAWLNDFVVGKF